VSATTKTRFAPNLFSSQIAPMPEIIFVLQEKVSIVTPPFGSSISQIKKSMCIFDLFLKKW
jgi:hypothetical protein